MYIVQECVDYEMQKVIGVFDDSDKAIDYARRHRDVKWEKDHTLCDYYEIWEFPINKEDHLWDAIDMVELNDLDDLKHVHAHCRG